MMSSRLLLILCSCILSLGGCKTGGQPSRYNNNAAVTTGLPRIRIAVWRVLGSGDFVGDRCNGGCRLTNSEITAAISDLQIYSSMFGPNVIVQGATPGVAIPINNIVLQQGSIPPRLSAQRQVPATSWVTLLKDYADNNGSGFDPDAVNIYFVGYQYLTPFNAGDTLFGATLDPASPSVIGGGANPVILIDDLGKNGQCSYSLPETPYSPSFVAGKHSLIHEMIHYAWRRSTQTICYPLNAQSSPRCYTNEHLTSGPTDNIMYTDIPALTPATPMWPGVSTDANTEKGEIFARIISGTYLTP